MLFPLAVTQNHQYFIRKNAFRLVMTKKWFELHQICVALPSNVFSFPRIFSHSQLIFFRAGSNVFSNNFTVLNAMWTLSNWCLFHLISILGGKEWARRWKVLLVWYVGLFNVNIEPLICVSYHLTQLFTPIFFSFTATYLIWNFCAYSQFFVLKPSYFSISNKSR